MQSKRVDTDKHLVSAGECFMFLSWIESTMRDLLVLSEASAELRAAYSDAYGVTSHPSEFSRRRLELGRLSFGRIKNQFLSRWPRWKNDSDIHDAIERIVIYRNGFGHAQVQPFREFLLYTPNATATKAIQEFMKCPICLKRLKSCECQREDIAEPLSLVFRCLEKDFLLQLYGDIQTVDQRSFLPTARVLKVAYQGVAWPVGGGHSLAQYFPAAPE